MRIARRLTLLALLALMLIAAFAAWQAYQVRQDLAAAEDAANRLQGAIEAGDVAARDAALSDFGQAAESAAGTTDGPIWSLATLPPLIGDDAEGVRAISESLDLVANDGLPPLVGTIDGLGDVSSKGQVDLSRVADLTGPILQAEAAFNDARDEIDDLDTSGYVGPLRDRAEDYVRRVATIDDALGAGATAVEVLPAFLGAGEPRDYLLVFQNNAEVRALGGIPGSWAHVRAENGAMSIVRQGSSADFDPVPVGVLSPAEKKVYSEILGIYWQNATLTPDWPRAAELLTARFESTYPQELDGVMSVDPVAMSYIMRGTAPVMVGTTTLTADSAVDQLLSQPYLTLDRDQQDVFFGQVAKAAFDAVTGGITDPVQFVRGLQRAVDERRMFVTSYDAAIEQKLMGSGITGALAGDDATEPRVAVGLADATASKMSYYLRYDTSVTSEGCADGRQTPAGRMELLQTLTSEQVKQLPEVVTGTGDIGIPLGSQLVLVRLYTPTGGTISDIEVAGQKIKARAVELDGRGVVTLVVQLDGPEPQPITWTMTTGEGQVGDGVVQVTPGVEPRSQDSTFASSC